MKSIIALALVALPLQALAVDITITLTQQQLTRAQDALYERRYGNIPHAAAKPVKVPAAAAAEVKQYLSGQLRELVLDTELRKSIKAAEAGVPPPAAFDPQ